MSYVNNLGPESSPIWILMDEPYSNDENDGVILSGGYGWNFKKIWKLGGLSLNDVHIRSLRPCIGASYVNDVVLSKLLYDIDIHKPTFIVTLSDEIINYLVPATKQAKEKNSSLAKWAGSLLTTKYITHPHYIIGSQPPDWVTRNWAYNEIQAFIDFGHVREEFEYWRKYGTINPLPNRNLLVMPTYSDLVSYINDCFGLPYISNDIETIRPKKGSTYHGINPGYPYTIALAKSAKDACSFSLWDYTEEQCLKIWRLLDELFSKVPQIGQNYFVFDAHYLEAIGFRIMLERCFDTLIRHHILWPCLKHALHFQTRQYTREPYYKDEGKNFNIKQKEKFMIYNAKDAAVTYEIFEEQEKEFNDKPHLR
jgi:hypothetical protein